MALSSSDSGTQDSAPSNLRLPEPCARSHRRDSRGETMDGVNVLLALVLAFPAAAGPSPRPTLPPTPPDLAARMSVLFAKASLPVRSWVDAEARKLRAMPPPDVAVLENDARQAFPATQPPLTPGHVDTLAAMAVHQVVNDIDSEARLVPQGPQAAETLPKLAERKSAFLRILAALFRKTTEADAAFVASLK